MGWSANPDNYVEDPPVAATRVTLVSGTDGTEVDLGGLVSPGSGGSVQDFSGTITLGGTAQQALAVNLARRYLLITNPSDTTFWINIGGTALAGAAGSFEVPPGWQYKEEGDYIPTNAISIVGATTGKAYTVKSV